MKILLFIITLFSIISLQGQIITIREQKTNQPLEMVVVTSEMPLVNTTTNQNGEADISAFKGAEKISIVMVGYKTEVRSYNQLEAALFNIELIRYGVTLDEFVVSATRWNQKSSDIPSKISSITSRDIALQNPQTAADLLATSGEVFIQKSQQGGGSPMIRGFSTNRLLYVVDGVRMNTAIFRSGNLQNVISLDAFATEKAEIFFGSGSVIYGSDAIGGVMSFQTLSPKLSKDDKTLIVGSGVMRYSSANNEKTAHADVNVGWKKWASLTSFSANDFGNLKMGSHGPKEYLRPFYVQRQDSLDVVITNPDPKIQNPTAYSQMNLMQKIKFKPSERWDIDFGFHYSETSNNARYDRHIRYKNGLPRYGEWNYGPQKWMMNNLSITNNGNTKLYDIASIRFAYQLFEESRISRDFNKPTRETRTEKVDAYSLNMDFTKRIKEKHNVYYGAELVSNIVQSTGVDENSVTGISKKGPARYPQSQWASYAAYINYQFKLSEKLLIQAGARYNHYILNAKFDTTFYAFPFTEAKINNGSTTGSLGLVYKPTQKWVISVNGSTGFRSPNVDDLGKLFDSQPGAIVVPNPNLKSEYVYNADLAIAKIFGERIKIDATVYYTILENAMVRRDFQLNGQDSVIYSGQMSKVQAIQNAAVATVYGIQAGFEIKLPSSFEISSRFNFQVGEEELDNGAKSPSRHAPPFFGVSKLSYKTNKVELQLYTLYSGERKYADLPFEEQGKPEIYAIDSNGKPWSPGWYTLNIKSMVNFTENIAISAGIENLTDQRYKTYSSGIAAPGRNFVMSLRIKM